MLVLGVSALGLAACEGRTDPATNIHAGGATLRFTGTANNGPAFSYFEYWKTEAGQQTHIKTVRRTWPAGASGPASEVVTGLSARTNYTFRVCGGDGNGPASCAPTRSFTTLDSDGLVVKNGSALEFIGAGGFRQSVNVSRADFQGVTRFVFIDFANNGIVPAAGSGCAIVPGATLDREVRCSTSGITRIRLRLGDQSDDGSANTDALPFTIDGGAGDDNLGGDSNREFMIGGPGNDFFDARGGNDVINARDGAVDSRGITCGENFDGSSDADTAYVDNNNELPLIGSDENCESVSTANPPPAP